MTDRALLGDIGGTNSRFAMAQGGTIGPALMLRNDDFADAGAMLGAVRDRLGPWQVAAIAAAGPLRGGDIRLANRDWVLEGAALTARFGAPVRLMNDLTAHVLAVPGLPAAECTPLRRGRGPGNGQWLVVNLGTGFNAAAGLWVQDRPAATASEAGMVALPAPVAALLDAAGAPVPDLLDDLLSGRGLAQLRAVAAAPETLLVDCLALVLRGLINATLPLDGVYLCGGVAAALMDAHGARLVAALDEGPWRYDFLAQVPLSLMTSPDAALRGCLAAL